MRPYISISLNQTRSRKTFIVPLLRHCTRKICLHTGPYSPSLTGFLLKEDEAKTKCSGIINLLFGVLVDNNKRGHFYS